MPHPQIKKEPYYLQGSKAQNTLPRRLTQIMLVFYGLILFVNGILFFAREYKGSRGMMTGSLLAFIGVLTLGSFLLSYGLLKTAYHLSLNELSWVKKGGVIMFWAILPEILPPYLIFQYSSLDFLWIIHLSYILLYIVVFLLLSNYHKWTRRQ